MGRPLTRILAIHPGALGDTLLALPVLEGLKQAYAPAHLVLLGHPSLVNVLPGRSSVDEMWSIEGPEWCALLGGHEDMPGAQRVLFERYDIAIAWLHDADGKLRQALCTIGIPRVIIESPRLREAGRMHATARFLGTLGCLDRPITALPVSITPTTQDIVSGQAWMAAAGLDPGRVPIVAVHPGSGSPHKCWPAGRFGEVVKALRREGAEAVVLEGPADGPMVNALAETIRPYSVVRLSNRDLATVVGVLGHCQAFVGNDSGVTHLAAGLGLPTVCLFGPTDPGVWASQGANVVTLRGARACCCQTLEVQRQCPARPCLDISPWTVMKALQDAALRAV